MSKYENFYRSHLSDLKGSGKRRKATCPFCGHKDDLSINLETGQCKCFFSGCEFVEGGDAFDFLRKYKNLTFPEAKKELAKWDIKPLGRENNFRNKKSDKSNSKAESVNYQQMEKDAERFADELPDEARIFLREERSLSSDIIARYKLGFAENHPNYPHSSSFPTKERFTIPIPKDGKYVNIRFHSPRDEKPKDLPWCSGLPHATWIFPEDQLKNDKIWLCEGEWDVLCAISHNLHAVSVTGGAGSWREEFTLLFKGKKVYIVYDCDKAGRKGAKKIAEILDEVAEVRIIDLGLGEGEDLTDWFVTHGKSREELEKLRDETPVFKPTQEQKDKGEKKEKKPAEISQKDGMYIKPKTGPITNFIIIPKVRVQTDEGEFLQADILTVNGKKYSDIQFTPNSWISRQKFKGALRGLLDLQYKGSDNDIQDIKGILASQNPPVKKGVKTIGLHKIEGEWIYVEERGAQDKKNQREDIMYLSDNPYRVNLLQEPDLTSAQLNNILSCLFNFNAKDIVYSLLGFIFACFVQERIVTETGENPSLICWGEKGSGKTATLEKVIKPIFGIQTPIEDIALPTKFSFARTISSSNLAPVLFDEHKPGRISQFQKDTISEMFRAVYNRHRITRGRPDLGITEYVYTAPVIVAGEMGLSELALKDRIVEVYFSKRKMEGRKEMFLKLAKMPLGALGKDFLLWTLRLEDEEIKTILQMQLENVDQDLNDRLRENTAHARLGLALFLNYLIDRGEKTRKFEDGFSIIDQVQKTNILEESNKTIVDTIIEAFSVMVSQGFLQQSKHFGIDGNMHLNLYISGIYPEFKRWARDYQWDGEVLDKASFLKLLKESKYFLKNTPIRLGGNQKWGVSLDLSQMGHLEIENFK